MDEGRIDGQSPLTRTRATRRTAFGLALAGFGLGAAPIEASKQKKKRCKNGTVRCGKNCRDVQRDARNCGGCGVVCGDWQDCCASACADLWTSRDGLSARVPWGIAVAPMGSRLWVTELWDGRVAVLRRKDAGGWEREVSFGSSGSDDDQLNYPAAVAASPDGSRVWVADTLNHRIAVWIDGGGVWTPETTFGSPGDGDANLAQPEDVAVSSDGKTVWVADSVHSRVSIWREDRGTWTHDVNFGTPGRGPTALQAPVGLAVAPDGQTVWVVDAANRRVSIWTLRAGAWVPQGRFGREGSRLQEFANPSGIAVSADGERAWIADFGRVVVWEKQGDVWRARHTVEDDANRSLRSSHKIAISENPLEVWVSDSDRSLVVGWAETGCAG